jgi:hypothetical protein
MKKIGMKLSKIIPALLNPAVFIGGLVLLSIGIYKIYPPAMFVAVGIILMAISLFGDERKSE